MLKEEPMSRRKKKPTPRPIAPDCAWPPARIAALRRQVFKKLNKLRGSRELQYLMAREAKRAQILPPAGEDLQSRKSPRPGGRGLFLILPREGSA